MKPFGCSPTLAFSARVEPVRCRRAAFLLLIGAFSTLLVYLAYATLTRGGWNTVKLVLFGCFVVNAPWLALSGATALIGFIIRMTARDPSAAVFPLLRSLHGEEAVRLRTALVVCTRNEPPEPIVSRLGELIGSLGASGHGASFTACLLSDTSDDAIAAREAAAVADFARAGWAGRILYRRRENNTGFKAGNVMSFLDDHADRFDAMLCLDADSVMTRDTVLRLVRILQADPQLAIVQPCFAGLPASGAFARLFQFGHRQGMRIWATGQAWWQADQGAYWGHNALIRTAPFRACCRLEPFADGTWVLSHDHVEAARLHKAGWKARVLPEDAGSFERCPPTLPDMMQRDARWAAGNLQYGAMLTDCRLSVLGRLQMLQALLHYALTPFWFSMLPLAASNAMFAEGAATSRPMLLIFLATATFVLHSARLFGYVEVLFNARLSTLYGGRTRLLVGAVCESIFACLLDPIFALHKSAGVVMVLFGRKEPWKAQERAERRVTFGAAARLLWPHTAVGVVLQLMFASASGWAAMIALPATAGLILAIPLASLTTNERFSAAMRQHGIASTPEAARMVFGRGASLARL